MLIILLKRRHVEIFRPRLVIRLPFRQKLVHGLLGTLNGLILMLEIFFDGFDETSNL